MAELALGPGLGPPPVEAHSGRPRVGGGSDGGHPPGRDPRLAAAGEVRLDALERSIIQSDIKSNFSLAAVESALRAHWTDDQVRRRDGSEAAHYEDQEDDEPIEVSEEFFESWDQEDIILYQEAQREEHEAWAQLQQARRTLQDARQRQKEVRLGRRYFQPKGKGRGGTTRPPTATSSPNGHGGDQGPCLRCGKAHATKNCPQRPEREQRAGMVDEQSEFVYYQEDLSFSGDYHHEGDDLNRKVQIGQSEVPYYQEDISFYGDYHHEGDILSSESRKMTTPEAMRRGYGVLDPGATRTMGSITALECARSVHCEARDQDNVTAINVDERPTFGFADSESARCSSTVLLQLPIEEQRMKLKVHALDKGSVPVLLSIDTLKRMKALVDYGNDEVVFAAVNPKKRVSLLTTATGHQILPLTEDFMTGATILESPISRLGQSASGRE